MKDNAPNYPKRLDSSMDEEDENYEGGEECAAMTSVDIKLLIKDKQNQIALFKQEMEFNDQFVEEKQQMESFTLQLVDQQKPF